MQNRVAVYGADQDFIPIVGTVGPFVDTGSRFNTITRNSSNANSDQYKTNRYFSKGGLYKIRWIYLKAVGGAKVDIGLDSSTNNIFSQIDTYSLGNSYNAVIETVKEIPRGYHDITWTTNGKNASANAYIAYTEAIEFDLIQEYPVYQDDRPAQINQGSMVLLAKHKAAIAEGTFTINLADVLNTKYSEIKVVINGTATASLALQATINALGANYLQKGLSSIGGAVTAINITTGSILKLASTSILTGATKFESWFTIKRQDDGTWTMGQWGSTGFSVGNESGSWNNDQTSTTTLTQIVISTSTSTWKLGTEIEVYGVKTT